jgi:hypothetical protein
VSARGFQTAVARLATDASYRDQILASHEGAGSDLTSRERARILSIASSPGMDVTATLIASFRLGKLLTLLPLTRVILGDRMVEEAKRFWATHPPRTFYFLDEALEFCDHLEKIRDDRVSPYLHEVLGYERAMLELRRVRPDGPPPSQLIRFIHDPGRLLPALARGEVPTEVPERRCTFEGSAEADGEVRWRFVAG